MIDKEFKKVGRLLKEAYAELEREALAEGVDIFGDEYKVLVDKTRDMVLSKLGFTIEEYRIAKDATASENQKQTKAQIDELKAKVEQGQNVYIPTLEDIRQIADEVAKTYVKPPQIITKVLKETIVEKPIVNNKTIVEQVTNNVEFDPTTLQKQIEDTNKRISDIKMPEPYDWNAMRQDMEESFTLKLKKNIDTLGMPDFRKLAMGLQGQIDEISKHSGGGTWGTITGDINTQTDLQTEFGLYVPYTGATAILDMSATYGINAGISTFTDPGGNAPLNLINASGYQATFQMGALTANQDYILPDGGGTLVTTAQLPAFETNGIINGSQSILNLKAGTNMTLTDDGIGGITFDASSPALPLSLSNGGWGITNTRTNISTTGTIANQAVASTWLVFTNTTTATITGLVAQTDGTEIIITRTGAGTLLLANQSSTSTAANRIITPNGSSTPISQGTSMRLRYDGNASRWRVVGGYTFASASNDGYLSSSDWFHFNAKLDGAGTINTLPYWDGTTDLRAISDSHIDPTNGYLGLGGSPTNRFLSIAKDITIADPSGFSSSLVLESLIGAPSDSPTLFYGPQSTSGSGTENPGYSGYNNNDSVDAFIYPYMNIEGIFWTAASGSLGNVTLGNNPSGIDWSWSPATNGDGSPVHGYIIVIVDNTMGTTYSYDVGLATSYADMNVGGTVPYQDFASAGAFTSSGQSFTFEPYNIATPPSGSGSYGSASGGDFSVTDFVNNGSYFWVEHSLSGASGTGWNRVFILDTVAGNSGETPLSITYYQRGPFSGPGALPYPQHYGFLSDGSLLNQSFDTYAKQTSPSDYYSSGHAVSSISDPGDGQYYQINYSISSIGGGNTTRIVRQDGYHYDVASYPFVQDAFGPGFTPGSTVTPVGLTAPAIIAQNSASTYDNPSALNIISTGGAPTASWFDNSTERLRIGYDPAASSTFFKSLSGSYSFRNSSNVVLTTISTSSVVFNANQASSWSYLIRTPNANPLFAVFGSTDSIAIGPLANTSAWINIAAGSSSKHQFNFATSAVIPTSVASGAFNFNGSNLSIDLSSYRARVLQTGTASALSSGNFPVTNASGNQIDSALFYVGGIGGTVIASSLQFEAKQGITVDSSKDINMASQSRYTGGVLTSFSTASASTSLNQTNHSPVFVFTGSTSGRTLTLPTAASNSGLVFQISNEASVSVTVATTSSQNINIGTGTVTSLVLQPGDRIKFIATASSTWDAMMYYQNIALAANGGTGIASYAVGDLLYASGSTTLSKLADVATGNALISGGVTTAPSWGKIGLTTHVTGVLPVANGGTGQGTPVVVAGSVSTTGTATTTFTVTIGATQANTTYKVNVTPTDTLAAAVFYVNNKTTTTFDVVYLAGLTGTVSFDWALFT